MKVTVGISGGVDSAVAAHLLIKAGHQVSGLTMTLGREGDEEAVEDSKRTASRLGIPLDVVDLSSDWKENVIDYIKSSYLSGETPNPCVRCNETVKFSLLPRAAFARGADFFATGHYARVKDGIVYRAVDHAKDQSYFLYRVEKEILQKTLSPLGDLTKAEVRQIAAACGIEVAEKGDSQDFCGGDVQSMVGAEEKRGDIVTLDGKVLGSHGGFWRYTVGKRKGLGIGGGTPYYVVELDAERNRVIVGTRENCFITNFEISDVVGEDFSQGKEYQIKVRSAGEPKGSVTVEKLEGDRLLVNCKDGINAVAPGQSAVFYDGDRVVFGGVISKGNKYLCYNTKL
jgi:tRNA-specific 2-thiouridylase